MSAGWIACGCVGLDLDALGVFLDIGDQQVLVEGPGLGHDLARGIRDDAPPVEDQLILAADEIAVGHGAVEHVRTLRDDLLAPGDLAHVERRGGDVQQQMESADAHEQLGQPRRVPQVLADGHGHAQAIDVEDHRPIARPEVPLLVEHAVVGQVALVIGVNDPALLDHRGGVVQAVLAAFDETHDDGLLSTSGGQLLQRPHG